MYNIQLDHSILNNKPQHVFFIGIGGVSMSSLAQILLDRKFIVSGSDKSRSGFTEELETLGATVFYGHDAAHITSDIDVVVYTAAVHPDNPEYQAAQAAGIPMLTRAELLGQIMSCYNFSYAIAGTHGKTTTTSMISEILLASEDDPTICNGGVLPSIGSTTRIGRSDYFVAEACEYTNSFFNFYPMISVVLNIEEDHLDFFKDIDDIRHSFRHFIHNTKSMGTCIINGTIPLLKELLTDLKASYTTFGIEGDYDYCARNLSFDKNGNGSFDVYYQGNLLGNIELKVPGEFNVYNALAAIGACHRSGVPMESIQKGLQNYHGAKRRFEKKGERNGITIYDDYAHHPTEIEATLRAAKKMDYSRVVCVFQPHTYTRTKALLPEFAKALSLADMVILADIFAARETDTLNISSKTLLEEIKKQGTECYYLESFEEIEKFILKKCMHGDLLITMGAGNVVNIGNDLIK